MTMLLQQPYLVKVFTKWGGGKKIPKRKSVHVVYVWPMMDIFPSNNASIYHFLIKAAIRDMWVQCLDCVYQI